MIPNSWDIETALIAVLQADATLRALVPDGVFYDIAPPHAKRFVVVSLEDPTDIDVFGGRAVEDNGYLVKASGLSTVMSGADLAAAAYRIDQLLSDQPLTVNGYAVGTVYRDPDRPRVRADEPTTADASVVWHHGGGGYRVVVSVPN